MPRSIRFVLLMAVLTIAAEPPAATQSQNPFRLRPGAAGKICLECHFEVEEQMQGLSVHTPLGTGACSGCHNPHAASHGSLLATDANGICADCHPEVIPAEARSVHQVALEGGCITCHDPHAAPNANVLHTAGNQLCLDCHADLAREMEGHEFGHSPVERDCMTCHDPHASTVAEFLLTQEMGDLCSECHNTERASFIEQHEGFPVAGTRCTSCHDPHGSDTSGILLASVHEPLTNGRCNQCHAGGSGVGALEIDKTGARLCQGCHSRMMNEMASHNRLHWPVADPTACLNCHSPHASKQPGLLLEPAKELCGKCHQSTVQRIGEASFQHAPVADGDCSACHAPHGADGVFLIEAASIEAACGECHDWETHSSHPLGEDVIDQRNENLAVGCLSCHSTHGSNHRALTHQDPDGDLCLSCHQQIVR